MTHAAPAASTERSGSLLLVGTGIGALAAAMGIGRFAFTPLLPLMLRDGTLDAAGGAEWAVANYVGYLLGAITAGRFGAAPARVLALSLAGVAATTLGAAAEPGVLSGMVLRFAAGVFSAWALICTSGFILGGLARRGVPQRGGWIYTGVGLGIAFCGILTWLGGRQTARALWLELGLGAAVAAAVVALGLRGERTAPPPVARAGGTGAGGQGAIVLCYGVFGFGYIVPATFLPAMARAQVSDPLVFGLAWPLFGLAAAPSVAVATLWLPGWPRRRVWALAQAIMAVGTALPVLTPSLPALAGSAVLVGGTFVVATMAGLQLARELRPDNPTPLLARMTVSFAAGQIVGPLLVRLLAPFEAGSWTAIAYADAVATVLLAATAAFLWRAGR